jgi:predicted DNA-binding protein (MmcQ/YjbR family)
MNIETFRDYCISKPGASEEFPFDNETLVFKVGGRMFALANIDWFESINLKCDPVRAIELREQYYAVTPGFHMNKKHWNSVKMDGSVPDALVLDWIDHSYELVFKSLPQKIKTLM